MGQALLRWLQPDPVTYDWTDTPPRVTITSAVARLGERLYFVHNLGWSDVQLRVPSAMRDVLDGSDLPAGTMLALGAWDVRVLVRPIA